MISVDSGAAVGWIEPLLVLALSSGAFMVTRKDLLSLVSAYRAQSLIIALIAFSLYLAQGSMVLLYLAVLTVLSKVLLIPYAIKRTQREVNIQRDVEFHYLSPNTSMFASIVLILLVYGAFTQILKGLSLSTLFYLGAVFGISLTLMGMMATFSRRKVVTKILGYLSMENGVLLFSLFVTELPFIIEVLVLIDLFMIVLLAAVLSIGIEGSVEEFQDRFNALRMEEVSRLLNRHKKQGRDG